MSTIEKAIDKLDGAVGRISPHKASPGSEPPGDTGAAVQRRSPVPDSDRGAGAHTSTTGVSRLLSIDLHRLKKVGYLTPDQADSSLAEEFRLIKRPLLRNATGKSAASPLNANLIMITSAVPHEGKTFCAVNLALSVAMEMDSTVLLVDADVGLRDMTKLLGVEGEPGLTDYLLGGVDDLFSVLLRTNVPKLTVLPAGSRQAHATELLASGSMTRLAEELSTRYPDRIIVFDSPPLLATSEASVLASVMGQVVLVVEAGRTTQAQVRSALELVNTEGVVTAMLNKQRGRHGKYYGGYYGYRKD